MLGFEPDAVFMTSWNYTPAYRAVMKAVDPRVVRVLIMDNLWRAAPKQWLGRATHRFFVDPVADVAMVPSDRTEFFARRLGFGPADVIRGSLSGDVDLFASGPRTGAELAGRRRFLSVGRLVVHKGADILAEAYRAYRAQVSDPWELHVAGIGPLESRLAELPGVTMHGFVQPPRVAELMRESSCLVLTSHIEPYGVVCTKRAAAGLPLLCAEFAGAAPVFVQDGHNGWLVPSGDVERVGAGDGPDERAPRGSAGIDVGGEPRRLAPNEPDRLGAAHPRGDRTAGRGRRRPADRARHATARTGQPAPCHHECPCPRPKPG